MSAYDFLAGFDQAQQGYKLQRETLDALSAATVANGGQPLTTAQIAAASLSAAQAIEAEPNNPPISPNANPYPFALPPQYPTGLPRFADSNPDPVDGWSIDDPSKYGIDGS